MNVSTAPLAASGFGKPITRSPPLTALAPNPSLTLAKHHPHSNALLNKQQRYSKTFANTPQNDTTDTHHPDTDSEFSLDSLSKPVVWHPQQEKLLKQWGEMASSNRWMHYNTHLMYVKLTMWFTLPVIILSSLTGTMNFAQSSFPLKYQGMLPLIIGGVNLITGMITTIGSFLRVSELAEGNRVAALSYGKIASNIRVELLLPVPQRTMNGGDFIAMCRSEMDRLTEQTPDIPRAIEKTFHSFFKKILSQGDEAFYTPDIMTLRPVEIYKDKPITPIQVGEVVANAADIFKKRLVERKQAAQIHEQQTVIEVLQHQHAEHLQKEKQNAQKEVVVNPRLSGGSLAFAASNSKSASTPKPSGDSVQTNRDLTDIGGTATMRQLTHPRASIPGSTYRSDFKKAHQQELEELRQRGFVRNEAHQRQYTIDGGNSPPTTKMRTGLTASTSTVDAVLHHSKPRNDVDDTISTHADISPAFVDASTSDPGKPTRLTPQTTSDAAAQQPKTLPREQQPLVLPPPAPSTHVLVPSSLAPEPTTPIDAVTYPATPLPDRETETEQIKNLFSPV